MSSVDLAYQELKRAILAHEFRPGERLKESALADTFGVSRTPVREAFNRLTSEGWLEQVPNQGVKVTEWGAEDVREIFSVRLQLEPYSTAKAIQVLDVKHIALLEQYAEEVRLYSEQLDAESVELRTKANQNFHELLLDAAGNKRISSILAGLVEFPLVSWTFKAFSPEDTRRSVEHHFEIVQAAKAKDPSWGESVMKSHILAAQYVALAHLRAAKVSLK